jgi:hypothetical protein
MLESTVAYTDNEGEVSAALELASQIKAGLGGQSADVAVLFISPKYNYKRFLEEFERSSAARLVVGCSSAGEFIAGRQGENAVSAIALRTDEMAFTASLARGLREDRQNAVGTLSAPLKGVASSEFRHKALLVLADALAGHTDDFIEQLNLATAGRYRIFGGGAGENAKFQTTHVFLGTDVVTDAAVALEILSHKPIGIGVQHGWKPAGAALRVTEAEGMRLVSLNATRAVEIIEQYAEETGQSFNRKDPIPFFLHNALGIETESGYKLRVPLAVQEDGSIICASDIPVGATVSFMTATGSSAANSAATAVESALRQIEGHQPKVAMFFDCVATRLRLGREFGAELDALSQKLGESVQYGGCNTYGQIARVEGQFSGFHNCTAVVCVIPG